MSNTPKTSSGSKVIPSSKPTYIKNKIDNVIHYARISTNNVDQISSLQNQMDILRESKDFDDKTLTADIVGVSNGMSNKLKTQILKLNKPTIYVTAIDRLTRDIGDVRFIRQHVGKIVTLRDNKTYDANKDWHQILDMLVPAVDEIDKIKERFQSTKNLKRKQSTPNELVLAAKQRVIAVNKLVCSVIEKTKAPKKNKQFDNTKFVNDIGTMIQLMQCIASYSDWNKLSAITDKYGGFRIGSHYGISKYATDFSGRMHIMKSDLIGYVIRIFDKNDFELDSYLFREFINSHINYGKKLILGDDDINSDDEINTDDDLDKITQTLLKISLNKNTQKVLSKKDLEQFESITNKMKNAVNMKMTNADEDDDEGIKPTTVKKVKSSGNSGTKLSATTNIHSESKIKKASGVQSSISKNTKSDTKKDAIVAKQNVTTKINKNQIFYDSSDMDSDSDSDDDRRKKSKK